MQIDIAKKPKKNDIMLKAFIHSLIMKGFRFPLSYRKSL